MRASLKKISFLAAVVGALTCLSSSVSAASFTVVPTNQVWKYAIPTDNAFCLNGTGWETVGYDDTIAIWASGPGGFTGGETTPATVTALAGWLGTSTLPAPTALGGRPYYFRTHFTLASTNGLTLTFTNRVDDQAVFFINGVKVFDLQQGAIPPSCTPGGIGGQEATTNWNFSLSVAQLGGIIVAGDNVLAVSVHQNSATSSDMVFGSYVAGAVAVPPSIDYPNSSLTNRTIAQCIGSTTLSVVANGVPTPTYQWQHAGTNLPGATGATLAINNARLDQAGAYRVIVSNAAGVTNSTPDTIVTVTADTAGPVVTSVIAESTTEIVILFNETINTNSPSPVDVPSNLLLVDLDNGSSVVNINDAIPLTNSLGYRLIIDPINLSHHFTLDVDAFQDTCVGNPMIAANGLKVANFETASAIALTGTWKYETNGVDLGTAWVASAYNDSGWSVGPGLFDGKRTAVTGPPAVTTDCRTNIPGPNLTPVGTCITLSNTLPVAGTVQIPTVYFRKTFTYNGNPTNAIIRLRSQLDDGCVFYLNGAELLRFGMPATGPILYATSASRSVGDAIFETNYVNVGSAPSLKNGVNTIAVEVHQVNLTSSDLTFGLDLDVFAYAASVAAPHLTISKTGNTATIVWAGGGNLYRSTNLNSTNNWTLIPGASSPFVTNTTATANQFFEIRP